MSDMNNYDMTPMILIMLITMSIALLIIVVVPLLFTNHDTYEWMRCSGLIDLPINNGTNSGVPKC